MKKSLYLLIIVIVLSCKEKEFTFDIEGHRGCRGLMPENTLPAFQKALELGVNTLEMDLAISQDKKIVVSHEPYFRAAISLQPDGSRIDTSEEFDHNMYQMPYDLIAQYEVGLLDDPRFPDREKISAYRPLLSEVVELAKVYVRQHRTDLPDFNIEIKRKREFDNIYHPTGEEFVELVLEEVSHLQIEDNTIIQSFDLESLQLTKQKNPDIRTALLIENEKSVEENITALGFIPTIYSCYYKLLDQGAVDYCRGAGILVIPWTVNEEEDIQAMFDLRVDGIISDYPDRVIKMMSNADH